MLILLLYFFIIIGENMTTENNMKEGIIYKSAASGMWYKYKHFAGELEAVRVDGVLFERKKELKYGASRCESTVTGE